MGSHEHIKAVLSVSHFLMCILSMTQHLFSVEMFVVCIPEGISHCIKTYKHIFHACHECFASCLNVALLPL
uniref:Uncharacterized protein n=1 Tax=Anguilla anguilla TaxID=7936 RepID=A0A0E9WDA3_ANGAN